MDTKGCTRLIMCIYTPGAATNRGAAGKRGTATNTDAGVRALVQAARSSGLLTLGRSIRLVHTDDGGRGVVVQSEDAFCCPICLSNTRSICHAVCLPCGHMFCDACITQGFANVAIRPIKKCPSCREDVPYDFVSTLKARVVEDSPPALEW